MGNQLFTAWRAGMDYRWTRAMLANRFLNVKVITASTWSHSRSPVKGSGNNSSSGIIRQGATATRPRFIFLGDWNELHDAISSTECGLQRTLWCSQLCHVVPGEARSSSRWVRSPHHRQVFFPDIWVLKPLRLIIRSWALFLRAHNLISIAFLLGAVMRAKTLYEGGDAMRLPRLSSLSSTTLEIISYLCISVASFFFGMVFVVGVFNLF